MLILKKLKTTFCQFLHSRPAMLWFCYIFTTFFILGAGQHLRGQKLTCSESEPTMLDL